MPEGVVPEVYTPPRPELFVTHPYDSFEGDVRNGYSPEDYQKSNDDFAAFIGEIKAKMTDSDDALVEWAEAIEGFKSAVSRRRSE